MRLKNIESAIAVSFAVVGVILALLDFSARRHTWYFNHPWFDMPMHALLGITLGLLGIIALCAIIRLKRLFLPAASILYAAVGTALAIGIAVEVAQFFNPEWRHNVAYSFTNGASDVLFDALGGVLAGLYGMVIEAHT